MFSSRNPVLFLWSICYFLEQSESCSCLFQNE